MRDPERLESLVEKTPDFILWLDRRGVVVDRNPAAAALAHVDDPVPANALAAAHDNGTWTGELEVLHRDGRFIDVSAVVVAEGDGYVAILRDISAMKREETALRQLAERDALTGLSNRHVLLKELDRVVASATASRPAALLYVDLDHLKSINDSGGHAAGDRYLEDFGNALASAVRGDDVVARVGGDEFAIVLQEVPSGRAVDIAESVRGRLSGMAVSASIGIAVIDGTVAPMDVLARADSACYAAKAAGGDRVHLFGS